MTRIQVKRGPHQRESFDLVIFPVSIGRDPENQIALANDSEISRIHSQIKKRGKIYILQDMQSRNGTFLNGDRIINAVLKSGDHILLGNSELEFIKPGEEIDFSEDFSSFNLNFEKETPANPKMHFEQRELRVLPLHFESITNSTAQDSKKVKKIFELVSNILLADRIEEAATLLLKSIGPFFNQIANAIFLLWSTNKNQMTPCAVRNFSSPERKIFINHALLNEVIASKQAMFEHKKQKNTRVVLPIMHLSEIIAVVQLEIDDFDLQISQKALELTHVLLYRTSSHFAAMHLRNEIDGYLLAMVETVIATIEAKDTYTLGHSERVCRYSMAIANELKLPTDIRKMLMISALCHDIGKIGIPDAILKKASMLNPEEYEEMKQHPTIGFNIMGNMPGANRFLSGIKYHHEKWDGTGYPEGLEGENIPFFGRIIAVADVFDAMISGRSYSGFIDESEAIEKIQKEADLFDPEIIKALLKAWENGAITHRTSTFSNRK